jgi:hypothetical protein
MTRAEEDLRDRTTTMHVIVATRRSGQQLRLHNSGRPTRRQVRHVGTRSRLTKSLRNQIFTRRHHRCRASHHAEPAHTTKANHWSLRSMHNSKNDAPKEEMTHGRRHHPIRGSRVSPGGG